MALTVQNIIDAVSQDTRQQFASGTAGAQQTALIDWTNRTHNEMLMWSNWDFMESIPYFFMTMKGQTDYWVGAKGTGPAGTIETNLNLADVYRVEKDSVRDMSNFRALKWLKEQPIGPVLTYSSGMSRQGQPAAFRQDFRTQPNVISIYPGPDNQNTTQPIPAPPFASYATGGALANRIYFIKITLVDDLGGESQVSSANQSFYIPASNLITVQSPELLFGGNSSGIQYSHYNVYAVSVTTASYESNQQDPNTETLQNVSPIAIGVNWTEPTSGLTTTGAQGPQNSTIAPLGGYIIGFRYFKSRVQLSTVSGATGTLQVPDSYKDIVVSGVLRYAWKALGRQDKVQEAEAAFTDGYRRMVVDKNLTPEGVEFVRPDAGSYCNTQILGYLPPYF